MKLTLLSCALMLSVTGWCASGPSHVSHSRSALKSSDRRNGSNESVDSIPSSQQENATTAFTLWGLLLYAGAITWWTASTKKSLDKTLDEVIHSMAQY